MFLRFTGNLFFAELLCQLTVQRSFLSFLRQTFRSKQSFFLMQPRNFNIPISYHIFDLPYDDCRLFWI